MKTLILASVVGAMLSTATFANNQPSESIQAPMDIVGKWKTIDDKTGFSRGDVTITKDAQGRYNGVLTAIRPLPDKPLVEKCLKCKGELRNKPFVGLHVFINFERDAKNPREYINGQMLDPLSGNVYRGKARMNATGKRLTLRGYIGVSMLGRNQTWIRAAE